LIYKVKEVGCCFITTKDTIMSMYPEGAAKTISEYDYGVHCLLIYTDLSILREFYSHYIPEQIEDKEQVVQIMPFYETEDSVRQTLSKGFRGFNIEKVENEQKSLIIKDSLGKYNIQKNAETTWNANQEMVKYASGLEKKESLLWEIWVLFFLRSESRI
jgi:hypothetical protein